MKKANMISKLLALSLAGVMCFGIAACGGRNNNGGNDDHQQSEVPAAVKIEIAEPATTTLHARETVTLQVTVSNTDNKTYFWSVTDPKGATSTILTVSKENVVSVAANVLEDTAVTVTATANADTTKKASVTFTVKPTLSGELDELNAEMFEEVADSNLTVTGTLTDYYVDTNNIKNNEEEKYDITVKMSEGAWFGSWSRYDGETLDTKNIMNQNYRQGKEIDHSKYPSLNGHTIEETYVGKNNTVETKTLKDPTDSSPIVWEDAHYSNGFGYFGTNISAKYTHDLTNQLYKYEADFGTGDELDNTPDAWQLTYLGYYFTPMLEATIVDLRLKVEEGHITTLYGRTATHVISTTQEGEPIQYDFTEIELHFSASGTTVVPEPEVYGEPENADLLEQAISKMKNAESYTFHAVENTVSAPEASEDEYTAASSLTTASSNGVVNTAYSNHSASKGTVGTVGYVTQNVILFEDTIEYTSYIDNPYAISYSGYKMRADGKTYENFEYQSSSKKLVGKRIHEGTLAANVIPQFDFSPNVFRYDGTESDRTGGARKTLYVFVLRDSTITRDIAMEISLWKYATDATAMVFSTLTLWVSEEGDLVKTEIPYSYGPDYTGYLETTFSDVGSTELADADFSGDNYVDRVYYNDWKDYQMQDYSAEHDDKNKKTVGAETALTALFGLGWESFLPSPETFYNVVGDMLSGPWYKWKQKSGTTEYYDFFTINLGNVNAWYVDENSKIVDVESFLGSDGKFMQEFAKLGYQYSAINSGWAGSRYYGCYYYDKDGHQVLIKIENIGTSFFYVEIYNKLDAWTKS